MAKAFFLDKDGTLTLFEHYVKTNFRKQILTDTIIFDKIIEGLLHIQDKGYKLIVISNQPWIGQRFILKSKLLSIMSSLGHGVFSNFVAKGISKMPPAKVYGLDYEGNKVLAFYIPPILEIHGDTVAILDGIHRSYLCGSAGTTINAVHINGVSAGLPFDPISWRESHLEDEKPPIDQRYKNLRKDLFRDLVVVGIDG